MIDKQEIAQLANLARLQVSESEQAKLQTDLERILAYVSELNSAPVNQATVIETSSTQNVMRADDNPHEPRLYTDNILAAAPTTKDDFIKVKKILG